MMYKMVSNTRMAELGLSFRYKFIRITNPVNLTLTSMPVDNLGKIDAASSKFC